MRNIWGFLLFTLTCSVSAAFILIIKRILADKLSPRWQYGVWSVLILRLIVPVGTERGIILPLPLWIEMLKSACETHLNSEFTHTFEPLGNAWLLPIVNKYPYSITDWVFVIYIAGILVFLIWHIVSYIRLRMILKNGRAALPDLTETVKGVSARYNLKMCNCVEIEGIISPFICGVFKPVLAVPSGMIPDEKIVLHELLHLKHHDALQNILWCIFRAFHWCNPFMQYTFNRISNDMESLCDQRVLERLEGEERREYGVILLAMANNKYAREMGTSSISNGGKNISRRIEAIARFKKYPKGMLLVAVSIIAVMANMILSGSSYSVSLQDMMPVWENELNQSMAIVRINRCGTVAGALDTYAKGLILENGVYIAAASPLATHETLMDEMLKNREDGWVVYHLDSGEELERVNRNAGYMLYNIVEKQDGSYDAVIALNTYDIAYDKEGTVLIPVSVRYENGWIVEENGERTIYDHVVTNMDLPAVNVFNADGEFGSVRLGQVLEYQIENTGTSGWDNTAFDENPKLNAEFSYVMEWNRYSYDINTKTVSSEPKDHVGMEVIPLKSVGEKYEFTQPGAGKGVSSGNYSYSSEWVDDTWDGTITCGGGGGYGGAGVKPIELPKAYAVQVVWDGSAVEEFFLTEVIP